MSISKALRTCSKREIDSIPATWVEPQIAGMHVIDLVSASNFMKQKNVTLQIIDAIQSCYKEKSLLVKLYSSPANIFQPGGQH